MIYKCGFCSELAIDPNLHLCKSKITESNNMTWTICGYCEEQVEMQDKQIVEHNCMVIKNVKRKFNDALSAVQNDYNNKIKELEKIVGEYILKKSAQVNDLSRVSFSHISNEHPSRQHLEKCLADKNERIKYLSPFKEANIELQNKLMRAQNDCNAAVIGEREANSSNTALRKRIGVLGDALNIQSEEIANLRRHNQNQIEYINSKTNEINKLEELNQNQFTMIVELKEQLRDLKLGSVNLGGNCS